MIRNMLPSDRPFVASSWLQSYRDAAGMSMADSKRWYQPLVDGLLDSAITYVACNPEDESHIFGWLCMASEAQAGVMVLHYTYVKTLFRDRTKPPPRIAKSLLSAAGMMHRSGWRYTFSTPAWERYMDKHSIEADHDRSMLMALRATVARVPKEATK
jgi:hypothetical protein